MVVKRPTNSDQMWGTYTKEFSSGVWAALVLAAVVLTLALHGTTTLLEVGRTRLSLLESFIVVIGAMCGQGEHQTQAPLHHKFMNDQMYMQLFPLSAPPPSGFARVQQGAAFRPRPSGAADDDAAARGDPCSLHQQPGLLLGHGATHALLLHHPERAWGAAALPRRDEGDSTGRVSKGETVARLV